MSGNLTLLERQKIYEALDWLQGDLSMEVVEESPWLCTMSNQHITPLPEKIAPQIKKQLRYQMDRVTEYFDDPYDHMNLLTKAHLAGIMENRYKGGDQVAVAVATVMWDVQKTLRQELETGLRKELRVLKAQPSKPKFSFER